MKAEKGTGWTPATPKGYDVDYDNIQWMTKKEIEQHLASAKVKRKPKTLTTKGKKK